MVDEVILIQLTSAHRALNRRVTVAIKLKQMLLSYLVEEALLSETASKEL